MVKVLSKEATIKHNLQHLRKLDPIKVAREWCEIDQKASGENWRPKEPVEWFWERMGLITDYEEPSVLDAGIDYLHEGMAVYETFKTEEGWRFETSLRAELDKIREEQDEADEKEQRGTFESTVNGIMEQAKEKNLIRVTQQDVKLYLFENEVELERGMIGMLTLSVNNRLGAKEPKRETVPPDLREQILRRANGRCENCGEPTKYLQLDHRIPVSRGGTNDPSNLQALCPSCNAKKGNK